MCKAASDFERSVATASDLKNCTMVNCEARSDKKNLNKKQL